MELERRNKVKAHSFRYDSRGNLPKVLCVKHSRYNLKEKHIIIQIHIKMILFLN